MIIREDAFLFECEADQLVGIIAAPASNPHSTGVLVVVGGPQYRVGSHRQFTLLARELAARGIPCMRFDYRGMGDSTGKQRDFERVNDDLRAAVDVFFKRQAELERVVLWGLCDGASAACFYAHLDARVAGLILVNPWVKTAAGSARVLLRHYYLKRLIEGAFWKKVLRGDVAIGQSVVSLVRMMRITGKSTVSDSGTREDDNLPTRMVRCLVAAGKPIILLLSGRDYVAREFEQVMRDDGRWKGLIGEENSYRLEESDHTFSSAAWRDSVEQISYEWVLRNL